MNYIFISRQGQTTWNTDCTDDADAHGYELPNPRISAQSAASAFPFRFDGYYFINMGSGKSTELNKFAKKIEKDNLIIVMNLGRILSRY